MVHPMFHASILFSTSYSMKKHFICNFLFFAAGATAMENSKVSSFKESIKSLFNSPKKIRGQSEPKKNTINTEFYENSILDALSSNRDGVAELIIATSAKEKISWEMVLHSAIEAQKHQVVEKLIKNYRVDINRPDSNGIAPIFKIIDQIYTYRCVTADSMCEEKAQAMLNHMVKAECFDAFTMLNKKTAVERALEYQMEDVAEQLAIKSDILQSKQLSFLDAKQTDKDKPHSLFQRLRSLSVPNLATNKQK
jgi:hypothetical protein